MKGSNTIELVGGLQAMDIPFDVLFSSWAGILMFFRDMPSHWILCLGFLCHCRSRKGTLCLTKKGGRYVITGDNGPCYHSIELSAEEMKVSAINRLLLYEHGYISLWELWTAGFKFKRKESRQSSHGSLEATV